MKAEYDFVRATLTAGVNPFPWYTFEGLFDPELLRQAAAEFPGQDHPGWHWFNNSHELKAQGLESMQGPACKAVLAALAEPEFRREVAHYTGIPALVSSQEGGGMHMIPPGGFLGVHADFNRSSDGLYRRVNALLYLNEGWDPAWGGALELHSDEWDVLRFQPTFNRLVLFETSSTSFHGHPTPTSLSAPCRKSLATYYYTVDPPLDVQAPHSTIFKD